jgi:hypothetical protein
MPVPFALEQQVTITAVRREWSMMRASHNDLQQARYRRGGCQGRQQPRNWYAMNKIKYSIPAGLSVVVSGARAD